MDAKRASQMVAILDAGAQYAKVIDRRVRELAVESEILPLDTKPEELKGYGAIIISGGPQSVTSRNAPAYDAGIFSLNIPILGICYGMQLMNLHFGGSVESLAIREDGVFDIKVDTGAALFHDLASTEQVLLTHGDSITNVASGFTTIATSTSSNIVAAIADESRQLVGVQFHPEVDLSVHGVAMISNFLFKMAKLDGSYTMSSRQDLAIAEIRQNVGPDNSALVLVSGGVDSSVCAALLLKALGPDRVFALHIDNGFMRYNESERVATNLESLGLKHLKVEYAVNTFRKARTVVKGVETSALEDETDPELIRKIIGDTFMRVSEQALAEWHLDTEHTLLVQGTLRPDLIESSSSSVSSNSDCIKTHHNDTDMVRSLRAKGKVIEPLRDYHKDEVRVLGSALGLSDALVWKQPFPGPGLAIRVLVTTEPYVTDNDTKITAQLAQFASDYPGICATLLGCRSVGVQGDARSYSSLVCLSTECDSVTQLPTDEKTWVHLCELAKRIPRTVHGVNRVIFAMGAPLLSSHCMQSITPTFLTTEMVDLLKLADEAVNKILLKYQLMRKLAQCPIVLFPADFGVEGTRSICIRPFITNDFMTGLPAMPGKDVPFAALTEIVNEVSKLPGIGKVCIDLSAKPPATTEWL